MNKAAENTAIAEREETIPQVVPDNIAPAFSLVPKTLSEAMELAKLIANTSMVPNDMRGKAGDVLVAIQMGAEVGLKPMQALQNIAVINGRPTIWGDALIAVVKAHPCCEWISESFDDASQTAVCETKRRGEASTFRTFSMADAKTAQLAGKKGPWQQYPKRMLQMRARGFCLRDVYPDVLKGLSVAEEAQDYIPGEIVLQPATQAPADDDAPATRTSVVAGKLAEKRKAADAEERAELARTTGVGTETEESADKGTGEAMGANAAPDADQVIKMIGTAKNDDDLAVCADVLNHLPKNDRANVAKVLREKSVEIAAAA